ncbi:hypothetical protein PP339_gp106 [Mycobacterium phage Onyinye]|uniref:Uncharacterized protein n=1 Tax=Mycobacterium phage Onyinye TaxID=2686235 RepID=A0A6B9LJH3_9CAUD|nr:hypothetical protein PP339_gp106 [Mycobacterium phage Onyinye]QHB37509.1 hypothetical protein SEA_ONYINYE_106 [Mycobacterium phage Onyinye]
MSNTEVRMIVMKQSSHGDLEENASVEVNTLLTAVGYDLAKGPVDAVRVLSREETTGDLHSFVQDVIEDMDTLGYNLTMGHAWAVSREYPGVSGEALRELDEHTKTRAQIFMRMLIDLKDKPQELLANMVAAFILGTVESALDDPELADSLEDWQSGLKAANGDTGPLSTPNGNGSE